MKLLINSLLVIVSLIILLTLTFCLFGIAFAVDRDYENNNGTLTVKRAKDVLEADYDNYLYEKEGLLYRKYLRQMEGEKDTDPSILEDEWNELHKKDDK